MQYHAVVPGVAAVAMRLPVPLANVYLHVALDQAHAFHFQQSVPEVRPGGVAGPAGVEDPYSKPIRRTKRSLLGRPPLLQVSQQLFGYIQRDLGLVRRTRFFYYCDDQIRLPQNNPTQRIICVNGQRFLRRGRWGTLSCKKGFPRPFPKNSMLYSMLLC